MKEADPEMRDVFAAVAMHALLASDRLLPMTQVGPLAYEVADSMLKARADLPNE